MVSFTALFLAIRTFVFVVVIVSIVLIMCAPGSALYISAKNGEYDVPEEPVVPVVSIGHWASGYLAGDGGQRVWGQMVVIIIALLFSFPSLIFSCVKYKTGSSLNMPQILYCALAMLIYLILGGVEVWYATGFGVIPEKGTIMYATEYTDTTSPSNLEVSVTFLNHGWLVAAVLFFLCAVLQVIDGAIVYFRRGAYNLYKY